MVSVRSDREIVDDSETAAVAAWADQHAAVLLVATSLSAALQTAAPIALMGAASFTVLGYRSRSTLARIEPYGGIANHLTAIRVALILCAALLIDEVPGRWLLLAFAANVVLDVADGYAARRRGQATQLGTVFDREADAVFVLVAYVYFFVIEGIAAWILLPGLLPYAYRLIMNQVLELRDSERKQRLAALLAGVNYLLLLAAMMAPAQLRLRLLIASTAVVSLSFLASFAQRVRK